MVTGDGKAGMDRVSQELRKAERYVDDYYKNNKLMTLERDTAVWLFLAQCEEMVHIPMLKTIDGSFELDTNSEDALVDNMIMQAKSPMRWLFGACKGSSRLLREYNEDNYSSAQSLSELGQQYLGFESAFTLASLGQVRLEIEKNIISCIEAFSGQVKFEAYDRLAKAAKVNRIRGEGPEVDSRFNEQLFRSVRVKGQRFGYSLNPQMYFQAEKHFGYLFDSKFVLPLGTSLSRYSLEHFFKIMKVIFVLCSIHFHSRIIASMKQCYGLGYVDSVLKLGFADLINMVVRYSGVACDVVEIVLGDLVFGNQSQRSPDPALQPLIPCGKNEIFIAPSIVINSAVERNFCILLNRIECEKKRYSEISRLREGISLKNLEKEVINAGFRFWFGNIPGWGSESEIDFVIISENESAALIMEIKSFLGPAEVREVIEKSMEIDKGVLQICARMEKFKIHPEALMSTLGIDNRYVISWCVASESSVGMGSENQSIPVIYLDHLIHKIKANGGLLEIINWIENRAYLPVEGRDFIKRDLVAKIGEIELKWWGIEGIAGSLY